MKFQIRPVNESDKAWVTALLEKWWAGPRIITRGKIHEVDGYPGFIAMHKDDRAGLITYNLDHNECQITSLNSLVEGIGIGSALVEAVKQVAIHNKCECLWLITTNDNTRAIHFWRMRRFRQTVTYLNAVEEARRIKPEIPKTGYGGAPVRDEILLEMDLRLLLNP